jgi:hypothetical protein
MTGSRSAHSLHLPVGEACMSRRIAEGRDPYTGARVQQAPDPKPVASARRRVKVKPYEGPDNKSRQWKDND